MIMKLVYWCHKRPAHIGMLRVASSFKNTYVMMHEPYLNSLSTKIATERTKLGQIDLILLTFSFVLSKTSNISQNYFRKYVNKAANFIRSG